MSGVTIDHLAAVPLAFTDARGGQQVRHAYVFIDEASRLQSIALSGSVPDDVLDRFLIESSGRLLWNTRLSR